MSLIDPHASWAALSKCAATYGDSESEQAIKRLILQVRDHMECEIKGDVPGLMATLTNEPVYHFWGNGEPVLLEGRAAVESFYSDMMARGGNQFQVIIDNIIASTSHVVTEGQVRSVYPTAALQSQGMTEINGVALTTSELWMSNAQLVTVWPNDGQGKLVGEDIYFGENPMTTLRPISTADLPSYFRLAA